MKTPEEHAHVGTIDVMCGFGAALGVAAALYQKQMTGKVGRARTSLSALSGLAQIPFCFDYRGRARFIEPSGPSARGYDALHRLYRAEDRWIVIAASEKDLPRFRNVESLEGMADIAEHERIEVLSSIIATTPAKLWMERFQKADIGAAICDNIDAIRAATSRPADGTAGTKHGSYSFSVYADHPSGHTVTHLDPYAVRPADAEIFAPPPAEKYGASTREVMKGLGLNDAAVDKLINAQTVSDSWSGEYLPS